MRKIAILAIAFSLAPSLLSGCGFYLKGQRPTAESLQSVSVSYEQPYRVGDPPLVMALQNRLRAQDKLVTSNAQTRIHLSDIRNNAKVLSVSPIDGRVSEIELVSAAEFNINAEGEALLKNESLSVRRAYSFDNTERLASEAEQDDLLAIMQSELADLILLRAETALARKSTSPDTQPEE